MHVCYVTEYFWYGSGPGSGPGTGTRLVQVPAGTNKLGTSASLLVL